MFIKSKMEIQRLSLNIGGCIPEHNFFAGNGNYSLRVMHHPEIDRLLVLPPVEQLSIRWVTCAMPTDWCNKHGAWCFATKLWPPCKLAYTSLALVSFIKSIRDHLLANGQQLGLSRIRGGLFFHRKNQQFDSVYCVMETDDSCNGTSRLITQRGSNFADSNAGSKTETSPRWPNEVTCMEVISDDFHESLRNSRFLIRPARKNVTFHLMWIDGLTASNATRALDCEDFWGNKLVRTVLGLTEYAAPAFATNTVKLGYQADPRNFNNYEQWRDRLRHLLQFSRWALQFAKMLLLPRTIDKSELDPSLFNASDYQREQSGVPNRDITVPDAPYRELLRTVTDGEANQTILFVCEPAWPCVVRGGDISPLWESHLHTNSIEILDRTTGLLLEY